MIKHTQTKTVVTDTDGKIVQMGNCVQTCIASLLDIPIGDVPNFETLFDIPNYDGYEFWELVMRQFLKSKGYKLEQVAIKDLPKDEYYLVYGNTSRSNKWQHACIYINSQLAHDPYPSREGLTQEKEFYILTPLNV